MVVLVSGGAGLLGSAIVEALLGHGTHVVAADSFGDDGDGRAVREERSARLSRHPWARFERGDLTDPAFVSSLLEESRPEAVVNAAVFAAGSPGARVLAEAARGSTVRFLVHLSDASLYGPPPEPGRHAAEDEALAPGDDPVLLARAAEEIAVRESETPSTILRVFGVLAPAAPPTRFPSAELEALLAGEPVPPLAPEPVDLLHVRDAARAVLLALERRPAGTTLNVGSGVATTPRAAVERLAELAGVPASFSPERASARPARLADVERVYQALLFAPRLSVDEALTEIVLARQPAGPAASKRAPREEPGLPPLSRRELFGFFRRPRS